MVETRSAQGEPRQAHNVYREALPAHAVCLGIVFHRFDGVEHSQRGILSLAMGLLFGRWLGTLMTVIASTLGALLAFLSARFIFADLARAKLSQYPLAEKIVKGFEGDPLRYLLFLRLVPLFPFWLVNLAPAVTKISTRTYIVATAIGVIPSSFVYANIGQALGDISDIEDVWSPAVILSLTLLGLLIVLPPLFRKSPHRPQVNQ